MEYIKRVVLFGMLLLATIFSINTSFDWISRPSDFWNLLGFALLFAVIGWLVILFYVVKDALKTWKKEV